MSLDEKTTLEDNGKNKAHRKQNGYVLTFSRQMLLFPGIGNISSLYFFSCSFFRLKISPLRQKKQI